MIFPEDPSRDELIRIVQLIIESKGTETELDQMLDWVETYSPHPNVSDLIFYPEDSDSLTAENIVDKIFQYRPIITSSFSTEAL
ncbi:bacteriocin immunity protein [Acaryochloris marina]|uniref:Colicin immunity protein / pyocin immunity protein n=1 Tax=Acaryochloris marina (strain MBIC 11017) TaxID=329726 RepID=B0C5P4_ACAM1|nr:bacteriocin immunity protein [Acaryochloris marina]ABW28765.1 conserved hypothetical protein [Acaryochloris marina MBIC11017]BDM77754.1 hypothetical protein AM10699_06260 [Acaryochloris marina MBIC10699]